MPRTVKTAAPAGLSPLTRKRLASLICAFVPAWFAARLLTLTAPSWPLANRHDATVCGQVAALVAFPLVFLALFALPDRFLRFSALLSAVLIAVLLWL